MENKPSNNKGNENPPPTDETQNLNLNLNLMEVVLAEHSTNDTEKSGGNHPPPPPPIVIGEVQSGGVGSMGMGGAVGMTADGSAVIVGNVGYGVGAAKKKRDFAPKNPPPGIPTCPVCHKTFANWKGAFGHMRKHPERNYRGFFEPPTFSSSSSKPNDGDQGSNGVEGGSASSSSAAATATVRGNAQFDLNLTPLEAVAANEVNKVGFDLNEFPQTDHDHEQHHQE